MTTFRNKLVRGVVATAVVASTLAVGAPAFAAKAGDKCSVSKAFSIEKVGTSYIRCEIVPGTSLHASDPKKKAQFKWKTLTGKTADQQWQMSGAKGANIRIDGSSTVAPLATVAAKYFESATKSVSGKKGVKVAVGISGTGGGFEKFCRGETDISNASRTIKSSEAAICQKNGITFTEIPIANDGLTLVVNKSNPVSCMTMAEVKKMWAASTSAPTKWSDINPSWPSTPLKMFGAGTDSGTFDAFGELSTVGGKDKLRKDVSTSEDDNVTVRGVNGDAGGVGYFGLSYAIENADKVKTLKLDKGAGCIEPTVDTVQSNTYPMSRPLFIYPKNESLMMNPAVGAFVNFFASNVKQISEDAVFVPLTDPQIKAMSGALLKIAALPKQKP
jgi:phosphate transport system substrate-binding protein